MGCPEKLSELYIFSRKKYHADIKRPQRNANNTLVYA